MQDFNHGPFSFERSARALKINAIDCRRWYMSYGQKELAMLTMPDTASQVDIIEAFSDERGEFIRVAKVKVCPPAASLESPEVALASYIEEATGRVLAMLPLAFWPEGLTSGLTDDRYPHWLVSGSPTCSMPLTPDEFERMQTEHARLIDERVAHAKAMADLSPRALSRAWIASLLPGDVLTTTPEDWRSPTSWEIRHLVGEGSFTGLSGAKAANLVGINPQSFRKYTAQDGASSRQNISYAMWHLLLHRLEIQS